MTIIRILLILTALNRFAIPQELFDPYQVHILEISFYNPDYDQILQERWEVDDKTYELATVVLMVTPWIVLVSAIRGIQLSGGPKKQEVQNTP